MIFLDTNIILSKSNFDKVALSKATSLFQVEWIFETKHEFAITKTIRAELNNQLINYEAKIHNDKKMDKKVVEIINRKIQKTKEIIANLTVLKDDGLDYEEVWFDFVENDNALDKKRGYSKDWIINKEIDYYINQDKILVTNNFNDFKGLERSNPLEILRGFEAEKRFKKSAGLIVKLKSKFWEEYVKEEQIYSDDGEYIGVFSEQKTDMQYVFAENNARFARSVEEDFEFYSNGERLQPDFEGKYNIRATYKVFCTFNLILEVNGVETPYSYKVEKDITL